MDDDAPPWTTTPPVAPPPPVAPKRVWSRRKSVALFAAIMGVALVFVVVAAIGLVAFSISEATANVPADAWIGECYPNDDSKVAVACDGDHHFEVFSAVEFLDDVDYPSRFDIAVGNEICDEDFELHTGEGYFTSEYDYQQVFPSEAAWAAGDRVAVCVLHHESFRPIGNRFNG